ncbi:GNAT family N-acetyltransferase [Brevundimonas variabilis]|uniref:RimJ/RimL family protein N-acetyltransferase n=1 Tax=Brevundimonas variabilis TaxID=74312 RepID=A0A7W9FDN3_9CAUL|nr:GNAT family N-acetyltransferase [Brevundimonas variabilis]MBB5745390.1 RimJ/RimL family protein N-acetyltransferase [Brevundimonas variabilis]
MIVRTERLVLRHARPDDLDDLHAVLSNPLAMRWWATLPHETRAETEGWLDRMIAGNAGGSVDFVIERDGVVIGKAGCWRVPDIGYILHPDHWGQGLATEAVRATIDAVFAHTEVETLTADVDPENAASIRLLERLGFHRTGFAERTWHIGGEWKDSFYYALPRAEWALRQRG